MGSQASVRSIDALKDLRAALALYGEDTRAALGAVDAEVRRTVAWLEQEQPRYWQEQIKRRREQVAAARSEVFRRKLSNLPGMSEQVEALRRAEALLQDAERRLILVRRWQPRLQQAILEYRASTHRLRDLSTGGMHRAVDVLGRILDALEDYLRVAPPDGGSARAIPAGFESIATAVLETDREAESPAGDAAVDSGEAQGDPGSRPEPGPPFGTPPP